MSENQIIPIRPLSNRVRINIRTPNYNKKLFQIRFWQSKKGFQIFVEQSKPGKYGPKLVWEIDGKPRDVFIIAPNTKDPYLEQCMLMLSYELIDIPPEPSPFSMLGGFDLTESIGSKNYEFLTMVYPAPKNKNTKALKSIDYVKRLPDQLV